jgi:hypothetical protein
MSSSLVSTWTFPASCNDSISNMLPLFAYLILSGEASASRPSFGEKKMASVEFPWEANKWAMSMIAFGLCFSDQCRST